jgi:hypothetical protein
MHRHIAFLHTSPVHVETFERLVRQADADLRVEHVVAEQLLADAQRLGANDPSVVQAVRDAMRKAAASGAATVVCTCSTVGGIAETMPTEGRFKAERIDRAMADRAVQLGPRVLVVAALESTLEPTADLILQSASALGRDVMVLPHVVEGAWEHFVAGDMPAYVATIAAAVRALLADASVVVLAQASMAGAAEHLQDLGVEVLSSPRLGVARAVAELAE